MCKTYFCASNSMSMNAAINFFVTGMCLVESATNTSLLHVFNKFGISRVSHVTIVRFKDS